MKEIAAALVKAQKAFGPALKTSVNPHFRNKYAALDACIEAVIDALNDNGIMLMQQTHLCEDGVIVETTFIHESGEIMSGGKLHVPAAKQDPQGYGTALTYAKRYSLQSACGIAPEDDDGNAATQSYQRQRPPAQQAVAKPARVIEGKEGQWQIKATLKPDGDVQSWLDVVLSASHAALELAKTEDDVMTIFKKNKQLFDEIKKQDEGVFKTLMAQFSETKAKFKPTAGE